MSKLFSTSVQSREELNQVLKSKYDEYFADQLTAFQEKSARAAHLYNSRKLREKRHAEDRVSSYRLNSMRDLEKATNTQQQREQATATIQSLESEERSAIDQMRQTMQVQR